MSEREAAIDHGGLGRAERAGFGPGWWRSRLATVILLSVFIAFGVYIVLSLAAAGEGLVAGIAAVSVVAITFVYLSPRAVPAKYLTPGLVLLIIFQLFIVVFSAWIAFTNYGDGHNGGKQDAIRSLVTTSRTRLPDSQAYPVTILDRDGTIYLLLTDEAGGALIGTAGETLQVAEGAQFDDSGKAVALEGFETLSFAQIIQRQEDIVDLAIAVSDDVEDGDVRTADGRTAFVFQAALEYDEALDAMVNVQTGEVYANSGEGTFISAAGEELFPGWRVGVGFENFSEIFGSDFLTGPLLRVLVWNFAYAFLAVLLPFSLGTFLALTFNVRQLTGRRFYRSAMIIPYMVPAFVVPLIWAGLLNPEYGFVNEVLLRGAVLQWFGDPWLARVGVLLVSLWMAYPFMFLITTGALQSIPDELIEAATIDGAGPWRMFRLIKLPLLLVTVAPLLVASFAYSFNNFSLIFLLTRGGPRSVESNIGATDILITLVYKTAFDSPTRDFGLASAYAILIFVVVGIVSVIGLRRTSRLEQYF